MAESFDAIVIGLGGIGSAAAYRLASTAGTRVLGLEQFELGHDRGASQDVSRITRRSYHRREYVELAIEAQRAWREIERAAGAQVLTMTGGLDLAEDDPASGTDPADSIEAYAVSMAAAGVPFEWLDDTDIARRWPVWRVDAGTRALFQADAGIADPEAGNAAHLRLAQAAGATLLDRTPVIGIADHGGEIEVRTQDGGSFTAGSVVLAADAWTNDLLAPLDHRLPLSVTCEQVTWFEAINPDVFAPDRFPIWIWLGQPSFYGFPTYRSPGPKVGEDVGGPATTANSRTFLADADCLRRVESFMRTRLAGAIGKPLQTKTCLYTLTPDRDFVVDRLPGHPGVIVALGAAHAYKFAALFGVWLAELALDRDRQPPRPELSLFALDRPSLTTNLATRS